MHRTRSYFSSIPKSFSISSKQVDISLGMDSGDLLAWMPDEFSPAHKVRRSSFYIFNLLLPCFLISFLAPLGFYMPADSGEKVSLGVTVLLALTVFQLLVAESMPPAESMPYIEFCIRDSVEPCAQMLVEVFLQDIASLRGEREAVAAFRPWRDGRRESSLPPSAGWKKREILGRPLLILAPVTSQVLDQSDQ
ncbi:unnamed protein product [Pleuronectes platessa]|uniref:Neurotransmitter-gated ion-channel transmembrane domain-containing protein n=1 Tax=Pleuronectes platessa TaxID=8262 RepID=A0A9N7UU86_PLEPL|nr:unnamed protein product [Pleuronectes platessa]